MRREKCSSGSYWVPSGLSKSKNDGYAFIVGVVQTRGAAEAMGGIGHEQAVADAEEGVENPVLIGHSLPGCLYVGWQGRGAAPAEDGRWHQHRQRRRTHGSAPGQFTQQFCIKSEDKTL